MPRLTAPNPPLPPPLSEHICRTIYATNLAIQRVHKVVLDGLGITYPQYLVLNLLWDRDTQSVSELSGQLELEPSTLTPLLKRLEAAGHLTRVRNPQDERQVLIGLTDQGRALRLEAGCVGANLMAKAGMSADDLRDLNARIRALHDNLTAPGTAGEG
ncbi:MarR family winged helix-turn-helix transcriptional regulator [Hyphomonas sp. NPDC076900]|uniref:MarR family winged helix-turn-helix transcriptional regulator n=1 Tax=unclassified Hyphomonas TaxID=2630699 RepID=UPI003D028F89